MNIFRPFNTEKDREAAHRIWRETGWLREGKEQVMDDFIAGSAAHVAELNGEAECLVLAQSGSMRYLNEELNLSVIASVTTSRLARKRGLASHLTAHVVANEAAAGALVAALGMFEQGYYNQLGFGTAGYERLVAFDPARLRVSAKTRLPRRIAATDWAIVHQSRLSRPRTHGGCNIFSPVATQEGMNMESGFGLGYSDGPDGPLTHHFWCKVDSPAHGPYRVFWMVFHNREQFLELLALLKSLGDQVHQVMMREPPRVQMQDLIEQPFRQRRLSEDSKFAMGIRAVAYHQFRICDLAGCLAHTHLAGETVRFNLILSDPIEHLLDDTEPWRGVAGEYIVTLGSHSSAERGQNAALPTLRASIGAFTRLWLGIRPASGLSMTDDLIGPPELLRRLDALLLLPECRPDWDF